MSFLRPKNQAAAPVVPSQDEAGAANTLQAILGDGSQPGFSMPAGGTPNVLQPAPVAQPRRSIVDTIGRVADVFAQVGGAAPLYQSTVDARENRQIAMDDHARAVEADKLKLASGQMDNATQAGKIVGQALRGVQAIRAANPTADIGALWPTLAQQAGVDPEHIEAIGNTLANDPNALEGLATTLNDDGKDKFSGQIVIGTDANGKRIAYQPGITGAGRALAGITPDDPSKAVNLGGSTAMVGRSGNVQRILPNTERPGAAADRGSRERIAAAGNASRERIAVLPARAKAGAATEKAGAEQSNVLDLLGNIESGFRDLHGMKALPGDNGGAVSNVLGALGRTPIGQTLGEQAGTPSAQKRLEIAKNVSALQQAMLKSLPASATRTKFEQEMLARGLPDPSKMSYGTARTVIGQLRDSYRKALAASAPAAAAPAAQPRRVQPARPAAPARSATPPRRGPSVTNW